MTHSCTPSIASASYPFKAFCFFSETKNALNLCLSAISNRKCDSPFAEISLKVHIFRKYIAVLVKHSHENQMDTHNLVKSQKSQKRAWQRMLSGSRLDLLDPSPFDIELEDIAHGLSRVARWNGQTKGEHAFSVAQHSVLVLRIFDQLNPQASKSARLAALLHDASEYVIGDMISPFKAALSLDYRAFEDRLLEAVFIRFQLPVPLQKTIKKNIKRADTIAAYFEATELAGFSAKEAKPLFGEPGFDLQIPLVSKAPNQAKMDFINHFNSIAK